MKKLLSSYPHLVKEWHPTKNEELTPEGFSYGSHTKVWWLCSKHHSYESTIKSRTGNHKTGCPYCAGKRAGKDNNLIIVSPEIAKEWHPTKNGEFTPKDFTLSSKKKVWWLCPKGHSYDAIIGNRTKPKGTGCPYCAGKKASETNNLLVLFPEIAKEWHPTKNGDLSPTDFTHGSRKKFFWLCPKGHSYDATISHRTRKENPSGCPYCSGRRPSETNNFLVIFPEISKEWHPTKNGDLIPKDFTHGSSQKVWWLCPKGHSYDATISSRTGQKSGCPYCAGQKVGKDNNLLVLFPEIAKEWHPTKNGDLSPEDFTPGSSRQKIWWLCPKGHSYESIIKSRTGSNNTGCPNCTKQTSEPEIRILSELKWLFDEVNSRYKIDGVEIDVFLPNFNLGIEYDGSFWHKDKGDSDLAKNKFLLSNNINLIRVRHYPLKPLSKNDIVVSNEILNKIDLDEILKKIYSFVGNNVKEKINTYLAQSSFVNDELFKEYRSYFPSPFPENSILNKHPSISLEWDYDKNYPLRPENFSKGSHNKVWWLCPKGHSYNSVISHRVSKNPSGCPYCAGQKVGKDNNLLILFPEIAKEWHPTKNGDLSPEDFTRGSKKKNIWWKCPKGHSYESTIHRRTGQKSGCPYCSGRKASEENNLLNVYPEIAKEWHPTKNGELTPRDLTKGSGKKVWWKCPKGHSYDAKINSRTSSKSGCPYCAGQKTYDL